MKSICIKCAKRKRCQKICRKLEVLLPRLEKRKQEIPTEDFYNMESVIQERIDLNNRLTISVYNKSKRELLTIGIDVLSHLPVREYTVLFLYYFAGKREWEIGRLLGISQQAIGHIKRTAHQKIKKILINQVNKNNNL